MTEVTSDLIDPGSADFRNLITVDGDNGQPLMLCGEVNAKNKMGGYTGFSRFLSNPAEKTAMIDPEVDVNDTDLDYDERVAQGMFTLLWDETCSKPSSASKQ